MSRLGELSVDGLMRGNCAMSSSRCLILCKTRLSDESCKVECWQGSNAHGRHTRPLLLVTLELISTLWRSLHKIRAPPTSQILFLYPILCLLSVREFCRAQNRLDTLRHKIWDCCETLSRLPVDHERLLHANQGFQIEVHLRVQFCARDLVVRACSIVF